ncbi:MAG: DUF1826 domain-containing protein [Pseudomonadales bacterium]|nr:DUF1826 domain-containing protein [Pseudomonadales bacterium]
MTALAPALETGSTELKHRQVAVGEKLDVLADIYQEEVNIAIWQRKLPKLLSEATDKILLDRPKLQVSLSLSPQDAHEILIEALGASEESGSLVTDISGLVDMFCCLFDINNVGLRLTALGHAMCPRFHVDRVPCRLVTTYTGDATEWLPHDRVDRSKLGPGSQGRPDDQSGLYVSNSDIQQLKTGEVALLKGECWEGNEDAGLVHRSPQLDAGMHRLLLTLDFANR